MNPTDWYTLAILAVIAVTDTVLLLRKKKTYSERQKTWWRRVAFMPYMWGVLAGHFGGPGLPWALGGPWASIAALVAVGLGLTGAHRLWAHFIEKDPPWWTFIIYQVVGIPCGVLLWPQSFS